MLEEVIDLDLRDSVPPSRRVTQSHAYTSSNHDNAWITSQPSSTCQVPCVSVYPALDMHLSTGLKGGDHYPPHFVGEKTKAQKGLVPSHAAGRRQSPHGEQRALSSVL